MIKQKNILLILTLIFILSQISIGRGRHLDRKSNIQPHLSSNNKSLVRTFDIQGENNSTIMNQTNYFLDTFDSNLDGWNIDEGWNRSDFDFHSPDYSINSFENNDGNSQMWQITSPVYTLPTGLLNETIHYSFWLRNDMLSGGIDNDGNIDQFFSLSILLPNDGLWHTTNLYDYDGRSYWCGDEDLNGYGDTWVQYLDTPETLILENSELTAMMKWAIEDTEFAQESNIEANCQNGDTIIDGWDQANVQISTNGGSTWEILIGSNLYDFQCGYGTVYNGLLGLPGWSGLQDWHEVTFDLSEYANQNVIIRFAFYSDPEWSTIDDEILTGFHIDNIQIDSDIILFEDNANDPQMTTSGENWVEELYDYWDDGSGLESHQPGSLIWEEYGPGTAFVGNILQNLTEYSGQEIQFRFQTFFDGDSDEGIGTGLFIDDFRIYTESTEFYPPPSNLIIESENDEIKLKWSNLLNYEGDYIHSLDSGEDTIFDETTLDCGSGDDCITYMGNLFYIHGSSSVDSVFIYNKNDSSVEVNLAAFSTIGQLFNPDTTYSKTVTLSQPNSWNGFQVQDWNFLNPYIIAHTITGDISISQDTDVQGSGAFFDGSNWTFINPQTGLQYFTAGIRAKITKENSDVKYNIYRNSEDDNEFSQIAYLLTDSTFIDRDIIELQEYTYSISATYPNNNESEQLVSSESVYILPASYQELNWDDGYFESGIGVDSGDSLAVNFRASSMGQQIVRFKWYQINDGGYVKVVVWGDSGDGSPKNIFYSELINQADTEFTATAGWNEYDLSENNWLVSGDFWIGLRYYSSTSPIGIDYDIGSSHSMYRNSGSDWSTINDWNFSLRVFLDCASENFDECGVCDGDNSTCLDCAGIPNGDAVEDCAGLCNGGTVEDCAGECGGIATLDCTGICNGNTEIDECGVCGGSGPTADCGCNEIPTDACDCEGHIFDECGVCDGQNQCFDCLDVPNGEAQIDECGVCSNPDSYNSTCTGCMEIQASNCYSEECCTNIDYEYCTTEPNNGYTTIQCEDCCSWTDLENNATIIPSKFEIINLYPNPFNPQINIEYNLPTTSNVSVSIYNVKGQEITKLVDSIQSTGYHKVTWFATNQNSGIYFVQITADNDVINRKMMYLK